MVHSKHFSGIRRMFSNKDKDEFLETNPDFLVRSVLAQSDKNDLGTPNLEDECTLINNITLTHGVAPASCAIRDKKRCLGKNSSVRPFVVYNSTTPAHAMDVSDHNVKSDIFELEKMKPDENYTHQTSNLKSCMKTSTPVKRLQPPPARAASVGALQSSSSSEGEFHLDRTVSYMPLAAPAPVHMPTLTHIRSPRVSPMPSPAPAPHRSRKAHSIDTVNKGREPVSPHRNQMLNDRAHNVESAVMRSPVIQASNPTLKVPTTQTTKAGNRHIRRAVTEPDKSNMTSKSAGRSRSPQNRHRVSFNPEPILHPTYGSSYDRSPCIPLTSWTNFEIYQELMFYKINEMPISSSSVSNTNFHLRSVEGEQRSALVRMLKDMVNLIPTDTSSITTPA